MAVKQNAPELDQCRQDIERYGKVREQCAVWVHQFRREPDRDQDRRQRAGLVLAVHEHGAGRRT